MNETNEPTVERRESQPYVAIRGEVSPDNFRDFVDSNFSKTFIWLGTQGLVPAGAPFIRFLSLDGNGDPDLIDLGVPVEVATDPGGELVGGELPAGEYLSYIHVGPFQHDELEDLGDASQKVLAWAADQGIELDRSETESGLDLACSAELYLTDPSAEPDFTKWQTQIVMLTAG